MARKRKKNRKYRHNTNTPSLVEATPKQQGQFDFGYHSSLLSVGDRGGINSLDPHGNFANSAGDFYCRVGPLTAEELIRVSQTVLIDAAIEKISNIVCRMNWSIQPPRDIPQDKGLERAREIARCLRKPNHSENGSYVMFIKSIVRNLLIFNVAPVQRQPGNEEHPFWLWAESPQYFVRNSKFRPETSGITPKFYFRPHNTNDSTKWVPMLEENLFLIKSRVATYTQNAKSAVEIAYDHINDWLGLSAYQRRTTSKAIKDYLISLDELVSDAEVKKIRAWWRNDVEGSGEIPIFAGKISVHKFGARTDAELFLLYKDHVAGLVALAFGLSQKDFNVEQKHGDNRATANVVADLSFQNGILPLADTIADSIDTEVIDYYEEGYEFALQDREPRGEEQELESSAKMYQDGLATRNEGRTKIGLDEIEGGDTFVDGGSIDGEEITPENAVVHQKKDEEDDEKK